MGGTSSLLSFAELYARSIDKEKCSYVSVLAVFRSPKGCLRVLVSAMLRKKDLFMRPIVCASAIVTLLLMASLQPGLNAQQSLVPFVPPRVVPPAPTPIPQPSQAVNPVATSTITTQVVEQLSQPLAPPTLTQPVLSASSISAEITAAPLQAASTTFSQPTVSSTAPILTSVTASFDTSAVTTNVSGLSDSLPVATDQTSGQSQATSVTYSGTSGQSDSATQSLSSVAQPAGVNGTATPTSSATSATSQEVSAQVKKAETISLDQAILPEQEGRVLAAVERVNVGAPANLSLTIDSSLNMSPEQIASSSRQSDGMASSLNQRLTGISSAIAPPNESTMREALNANTRL